MGVQPPHNSKAVGLFTETVKKTFYFSSQGSGHLRYHIVHYTAVPSATPQYPTDLHQKQGQQTRRANIASTQSGERKKRSSNPYLRRAQICRAESAAPPRKRTSHSSIAVDPSFRRQNRKRTKRGRILIGNPTPRRAFLGTDHALHHSNTPLVSSPT